MDSRNETAVIVENISKYYRIGSKAEKHDSAASAVFGFLKSPISNYLKYRALYNFKDTSSSNIIKALDNISFEVGKSEVLGIIGRNGAGKSTLLKILSRITYPTTGFAEIRGRVSSLLEVGTGFHPELTGKENIYLNGTILGMLKKEIDHKFDDIVSFSGIEKFIYTPVKRYSSGMKVRLAFSVAAHLEPEILIIDEVLAVGDADFQKQCLNKMEDVGKQGRTVLFVSHNMPAVARLCRRAIHIDMGRLVDDGEAAKVVKEYLSRDTGSMAVQKWNNPENAPGDSVARLMSVAVRNENGDISDSIDIRKPFTIEMEYEVFASGYKFLPHYGLRNDQGDSVFLTLDQDKNWRRKERPAGRYVSRAHIPGNLLSEGLLYVNCHLLSLDPDTLHFSERSVVSFVVIDSMEGDSARSDYARNMPGVVRPLLNWSTDYDVR